MIHLEHIEELLHIMSRDLIYAFLLKCEQGLCLELLLNLVNWVNTTKSPQKLPLSVSEENLNDSFEISLVSDELNNIHFLSQLVKAGLIPMMTLVSLNKLLSATDSNLINQGVCQLIILSNLFLSKDIQKMINPFASLKI